MEIVEADMVTEMSQQQPQLYNNLTAALGPEEQQVIKAAVETADKIAAEQQNQAATAATARPAVEGAPPQANGAS